MSGGEALYERESHPLAGVRSERQEAFTVLFGTGCSYDADGRRTYHVLDSRRRGNGESVGHNALISTDRGDLE